MKKNYFISALTIISSLLIADKNDIVDIKTFNQNIRIDPRYSTEHNFTGKPVYNRRVVLIHKDVAQALDAVQKELEQQGLGLLVWDGYRSSYEQQKLWQVACNLGGEALNHVSDPATSSGWKNRGTLVELTLVDQEGNLLEMPTDFDELSEKAHSNYMNLPENVIKNRAILHEVMVKQGFKNFELEWWHFRLSVPDWRSKYPPIEMTSDEIEQKIKNN